MHGQFHRFSAFAVLIAVSSTLNQQERQRHTQFLLKSHSAALTPVEQKLHAYTISELVSKCRSGDVTPEEILKVYTTKTLQAQKETNCVTDILVEDALNTSSLANWGPAADSDSGTSDAIHGRPLLGVPVSLKGEYTDMLSSRSTEP